MKATVFLIGIALLSGCVTRASGPARHATSEGDMKVVAIDAHSFEVVAEIPVLAFPRVLAVTPDGRLEVKGVPAE